MKPFFVVGTRPEIVKMAPIIQECDRRNVEYFLLHTGQHYSDNMSELFFDDMGLRQPDKNLEIGSGSHSEQTAKALLGIERELINDQPDVVLVQGDTNAVLSATLAAVKLMLPVAHVEAGLRSYDMRMPEEHNRRLTDHASEFLFAPTMTSARILERENVWGKVFVTGNTVIDALEDRLPIAKQRALPEVVKGLDEFGLMTLHRAENVDNKETLTGLIEGLIDLGIPLIFPAHPRTVSRLNDFGLMKTVREGGSICIIDPVGYLDFLNLMSRCSFVISDSGGIQEEVTAPSINKQVFVLRISTERPEAVKSGHASVVGVDPSIFPEMIRTGLDQNSGKERSCPYGDGTSGRLIVSILTEEMTRIIPS